MFNFSIRRSQGCRLKINDEGNDDFSRLLQSFFQPIEIFPTETQIEFATRTVRYCDIISPINRSCPISLENFTDSDIVSVIRFCGHIFNSSELNTWFRTNCRCPVCRYDIRNYTASSRRSQSSSESNDERNVETEIPVTMSTQPTDISNNYTNNTYYREELLDLLNNSLYR